MDIYDIRRANLRELMRTWGGPTSLAHKLGHTNGSYIAQLAGPNPSREISEKVARGIEQSLALPIGWMDKRNEPGQSAPGLDDTLLTRCIRAVTAAAEDLGARPPAHKFADLVALAYEHAQVTGQCNEAHIKRLVRLTK